MNSDSCGKLNNGEKRESDKSMMTYRSLSIIIYDQYQAGE